MNVGFTGTRTGLSMYQLVELRRLLAELKPDTFHHGDCVGADQQAHTHFVLLYPRTEIVVHPPTSQAFRANVTGLFVTRKHKKPFLERNHDIVNESDVIIACPKEGREERRSGTWATVRYARKAGKPIYIIKASGKVVKENI